MSSADSLSLAKHLKEILKKITEANLTLNSKKCTFANAEVDFLGDHLGLNTVQPLKRKIVVLVNFPRPTNKKQVASWLGLARYYMRFLHHFSELTLPLTQLLKKNKGFEWPEKAENAFVELKSRMSSRPILRPPDYSRRFCLAVDVFTFCVRGLYVPSVRKCGTFCVLFQPEIR